MSDDLIRRLDHVGPVGGRVASWCKEAAEAIKRLTRERDQLAGALREEITEAGKMCSLAHEAEQRAAKAEKERDEARAAAMMEAALECDRFDGPVSRSNFVNGQTTAAQQIRASIGTLIDQPAPKPSIQDAARMLLSACDMGSAHDDFRATAVATAFGVAAYEKTAMADAAARAMARAFLTAIIDPADPELDWLRADCCATDAVKPNVSEDSYG